jgi:hypothetical protein
VCLVGAPWIADSRRLQATERRAGRSSG